MSAPCWRPGFESGKMRPIAVTDSELSPDLPRLRNRRARFVRLRIRHLAGLCTGQDAGKYHRQATSLLKQASTDPAW
jgi:hypothetical protein